MPFGNEPNRIIWVGLKTHLFIFQEFMNYDMVGTSFPAMQKN